MGIKVRGSIASVGCYNVVMLVADIENNNTYSYCMQHMQ